MDKVRRPLRCCLFLLAVLLVGGRATADHVRELQAKAIAEGKTDWGHWGPQRERYISWAKHTNRLIPVYTFGIDLAAVKGQHNAYRSADRLASLYGRLPEATLNPQAEYFDQTQIYELQKVALAAGKKYLVLVVFDGTDWQTTWAAAVYRSQKIGYREGRGTGLAFQDYRGTLTDYGYMVTSPHNDGTSVDVNAQAVLNPGGVTPGGYDWLKGGSAPWAAGTDPNYIAAQSRDRKQAYTDSSSSATSLTAGIKTYNNAINVDDAGHQVVPIARELQAAGFAVGVVTSVPISHATPASAYANNVERDDFQDLSRDLVGLPSISHPTEPLPGVDVLLGAGWGVEADRDPGQGLNFVPGNVYLPHEELNKLSVAAGGRYRIVERTPGKNGQALLAAAATEAAGRGERLFGSFGVGSAGGGHLPFRTADGKFDPAGGFKAPAEQYTPADLNENPSLADMTSAALVVLEKCERGFWLMVEAGDVDWGNHDANVDNAIGAVISGDEAFRVISDWVESRGLWDQTAVIVTADHGHYFVLERPEVLLAPSSPVGQ